jgi:hypothetical protein
MNTAGHRYVAEQVGEPLLRDAIKKRLKLQSDPSLKAFYLGNWLTDVSQAVDPVASQGFADKIKASIVEKIAYLRTTILSTKIEGLETLIPKAKVDALLKKAQNDLLNSVDRLILTKNSEGHSQIQEAFKTIFRVHGYFKFSHPDPGTSKYRMNPDAYLAVFDYFYTQYFPHEHLDRPEILQQMTPVNPQKPPPSNYESDFATGPYTQPATGRPDMYLYLREDIKIIAGLLSNVDRCFARKRFRPGERLEDNDPSWQFGLADLGHALHGVEDFFAHSEFIEFAAQLLGSDYQPDGSVSTNKLLNPNFTLFQKRLRRWDIKDHASWTEYATEDRIVTGFFDGVDTLFALVEMVIDLWGIEPIDPLQTWREFKDEALDDWKLLKTSPKEFLKDKVATPAEEKLRQALDYFSDRDAATKDPENDFAKAVDKKVKELGRFDEPAVSGEVMKNLLSDPTFSRLSPQMRGYITDYFNTLNGSIGKVRATRSLYKDIKDISKFARNPIDWIIDQFKEELTDKAKGMLVFITKEALGAQLGKDRIGCHSLLAKDHGDEFLFDHMQNCAMAVHWYVVRSMCRWADEDFRTMADKKEDHSWIDWLELLERFLANPVLDLKEAPAHTHTVATTIQHVVVDTPQRSDSLKNLAQRYAATTLNGQTSPLTWREIADANFATATLKEPDAKNVINAVLKATGTGYLVSDQINYAFKAGTIVMIPRQKAEIQDASQVQADTYWWADVMARNKATGKKDGWKVFSESTETTATITDGPIKYHKWVFLASETEALDRMHEAQSILDKRENAYQVLRPDAKRTDDLRRRHMAENPTCVKWPRPSSAS